MSAVHHDAYKTHKKCPRVGHGVHTKCTQNNCTNIFNHAEVFLHDQPVTCESIALSKQI